MNVIRRIGPLGWVIIAGIIGFTAYYFGKPYLYSHGIIGKSVQDTKVLEGATSQEQQILTTAPANFSQAGLKPYPNPSNNTIAPDNTYVNVEYWGMAWNAQVPLAYSIGGVETTQGSLFDQNKIHAKFVRQDSYDKMKEKAFEMAQQFKNDPKNAPIFIHMIMGDGMVTYGAGAEAKIKEVDPSYALVGFYVSGFSYGEDKFIGPYSWRMTPDSARGGICVVYPLDGDHNIPVKWATDNKIPINPDMTTWDPDALNFVSALDFLDAAQKYIARKSKMVELAEVHTDPITHKTTKTGRTVRKYINATSTWLPGDEKVFNASDDDIVTLMDTKTNSQQMPCLFIGLNKQLELHKEKIKDMIWALAQAGDQVKTYPNALKFACDVETQVYGGTEDGNYWYKYFRGESYTTKFNRTVTLGGTRACNLMDNVDYFGINGGPNRYETVYKFFGKRMMELYPKNITELPNINTMLDLSYLKAVYAEHKGGTLTESYKPTLTPGAIVDVTSRANYKIEFLSGSDQLTAAGMKVLNELYLSVGVSDQKIQIYGYTDSDGDDASNQILSDARALAVKAGLIRLGIKPERFTEVMGYGESRPVGGVDDTSYSGKAKNRRVEIVVGD
jgi:outer membrane protein OmpA-like peptidoglycan-associated protein